MRRTIYKQSINEKYVDRDYLLIVIMLMWNFQKSPNLHTLKLSKFQKFNSNLMPYLLHVNLTLNGYLDWIPMNTALPKYLQKCYHLHSYSPNFYARLSVCLWNWRVEKNEELKSRHVLDILVHKHTKVKVKHRSPKITSGKLKPLSMPYQYSDKLHSRRLHLQSCQYRSESVVSTVWTSVLIIHTKQWRVKHRSPKIDADKLGPLSIIYQHSDKWHTMRLHLHTVKRRTQLWVQFAVPSRSFEEVQRTIFSQLMRIMNGFWDFLLLIKE